MCSTPEDLLSRRFALYVLCALGVHAGECGSVELVLRALLCAQSDEQVACLLP